MYLKGDGEAKSGFHFLKEKKGYVRINKVYINVHILENTIKDMVLHFLTKFKFQLL